MINKKLLTIAFVALASSFTFAKETKQLETFSSAENLQQEFDNNQELFMQKYKDKRIEINSITLTKITPNEGSITLVNKQKAAHMYALEASTDNPSKPIFLNAIDYRNADSDDYNLSQDGGVTVKVICNSLSTVSVNVLNLNNCTVM
ncbi:hypothetical protein P256_00695 [Acinetobacter nectaris CIP 110549]|uniref:Uncharacterized protein n=1 Tax=Acinetobacter nectaris CIP 110549 TaxID=1392540 RepID=V2TC96_9GAMM|nr:hypothetical protein [Acinetobacter nectaris]ESK40248.1 hypothetical protein P256_00695 [Acinetobacter nectaris CIP 110549]